MARLSAAGRTIVVQTAQTSDLARRHRRSGQGFPQAFPQIL
jgi:hypothetical protein